MKTVTVPVPIPIAPGGFRFLDQDHGNINGDKLISLITSKKFSKALKFIENKSALGIEHEIAFTCIDAEGNTALHLAVKSNKLKLVKAIVEGGGTLYAINFSLKTPLDLSKEIGSSPIKEYLESILAKEGGMEEGILQIIPELNGPEQELESREIFFLSMQFDPVVPTKKHQEFTRVTPILFLPKQQFDQEESIDDEIIGYFSSLDGVSLSTNGMSIQESRKSPSVSGSAPIDVIVPSSRSSAFQEDSPPLFGSSFDDLGSVYDNIESSYAEVVSAPKNDRFVLLPKKTEAVTQEIAKAEKSTVVVKMPVHFFSDSSEDLIFSFDDDEDISGVIKGVSPSGDVDED